MRFKELSFDLAAEALVRSVALDSSDAATFTDLAQVEMKRRDYAAAEKAARRAIALDRFAKEAYFVLSNVLKRLGRREENKQVLVGFRALDQQLDKINDQLRMLGNEPDDHEARAQLGLLYTQQGRFTEAAEAYRLASRIAPDSLRYRNNLGNLYLRLGQPEAAVVEYRVALQLDSNYTMGHYNLGQAFMRLQRFDEALTSLNEAKKQSPEDVEVNYFLGLLHARTGDFAGAAEALAVAVVGRPEFLDARQKLAVAYLKTGRVEESKRELAAIQQMKEEGERR
jgi:tetratricopeptide (TPR) repeat protein